MTTIYHFFGAWKDLITHIYSDYPLAAAITTLVAVGVFVYVERAEFENLATSTFHLFAALIVWAIVVPILGSLFGVVEKLYNVYDKHPLLVLVLFIAAVAVFLIWGFLRPKSPSRAVKAIACAILFLLSVAVAAPIANMFSAR
jgi:predicted membrane protein